MKSALVAVKSIVDSSFPAGMAKLLVVVNLTLLSPSALPPGDGEPEEFITILELPPVDSAQSAVKVIDTCAHILLSTVGDC